MKSAKDTASAGNRRPNRRTILKSLAYTLLTIKADLLFGVLRAEAQQAGRPISVIDLQGEHPGVPTVTPDGSIVVSVNQESSNLSLVDTSDLRLIGTISLSGRREPWEIAFTPDGKLGFVSHSSFDSSHDEDSIVTVVDMTARREIKQIDVGRRPNGVAVDRDGKYVFVANMGSNTVSVISVQTLERIRDIPVGRSPFDIVVTPLNVVVAVNFYDASLSFISLPDFNVFATVPVGTPALDDPYPEFGAGDSAQAAVNRWNGDIYVSNYRTHSVAVVDSNTRVVKARIPTIQFPFGISVREEANLVTVLSGESRALGVIDLGPSDHIVERFGGLEPSVRDVRLQQVRAQTNRQIEVIPLGRGAGKPPLRLPTSRARDLKLLYVDPIRGKMYVIPHDRQSESGTVLFGGPAERASDAHSGA
jgi:YVTN family beta-propeller protein